MLDGYPIRGTRDGYVDGVPTGRGTMTGSCTQLGQDRRVIDRASSVNVATPVAPGQNSRRQTLHRTLSAEVVGSFTQRAAVITESQRAAACSSGVWLLFTCGGGCVSAVSIYMSAV